MMRQSALEVEEVASAVKTRVEATRADVEIDPVAVGHAVASAAAATPVEDRVDRLELAEIEIEMVKQVVTEIRGAREIEHQRRGERIAAAEGRRSRARRTADRHPARDADRSGRWRSDADKKGGTSNDAN